MLIKILSDWRVWLGLVGLLLVVAATVAVKRYGNEAKEAGRQEERATQAEEVIKRVEEKNDVEQKVQASDDAGAALRYDQCVRYSRTPANCQRLLPQRPDNSVQPGAK